MGKLAASVAAVRGATRQALVDFAGSMPAPDPGASPPAPPLAVVACSGGPDSLALAAAVEFVASRTGWRAGLLTVDHQLQAGSGQRAETVAWWARGSGFAPVEVLPVPVLDRRGGPEAAARTARYQALAGAARRLGAAVVLLGHTRDDQAETVLLALARGAGPRGLAGMPPRREAGGVTWLRPLLGVTRVQTAAACRALGLKPWQDPHNTDPSYARARVRQAALPALVAALGERVVDNLARSARLLAADTAALDEWAQAALGQAQRAGSATPPPSTAPPLPGAPPPPSTAPPPPGAPPATPPAPGEPVASRTVAVAVLQELPAAVRTRVLHAWARQLGAGGSALSHRHVAALAALVTDWRGQGPTHLPGGITVARRGDRLVAGPPAPGGGTGAGQL